MLCMVAALPHLVKNVTPKAKLKKQQREEEDENAAGGQRLQEVKGCKLLTSRVFYTYTSTGLLGPPSSNPS